MALLHFQPITPDFRLLNIIAAIIQLLILIGLSRIPKKNDIAFIPLPKKDALGKKIQPPTLLISGTFFVFTIICLCTLSSSSTAENIENGISIFYISSLIWTLLFVSLYFRKKANPFILYTVLLGVTALGFILWLLPFPVIKPLSIMLQGADLCLANLSWFIAAVLFESWNKRIIAPICILIALITALLHSAILDLLRGSTATLYAIYAGVSLILLVGYFLTEPYFRRVWLDAYSGTQKNSTTKSTAVHQGIASEEDPYMEKNLENELLKTLTKRELEVLPLIIHGYDNASIAKILFISENTVKTHVKNIFSKTDVHTRFELASKFNLR